MRHPDLPLQCWICTCAKDHRHDRREWAVLPGVTGQRGARRPLGPLILILRDMALGSTRCNDIERGLPGIFRTLLAQRLRHLEREGVLQRRPARSTSVGNVAEGPPGTSTSTHPDHAGRRRRDRRPASSSAPTHEDIGRRSLVLHFEARCRSRNASAPVKREPTDSGRPEFPVEELLRRARTLPPYGEMVIDDLTEDEADAFLAAVLMRGRPPVRLPRRQPATSVEVRPA
jgi:HxlR-like helix-turn-helix